MQENEQEDRAYENAAYNNKTEGNRQVNEAQGVVQKVKAHKKEQDDDVYENDVWEYWLLSTKVLSNDWREWWWCSTLSTTGTERTKTCEKEQVSMA